MFYAVEKFSEGEMGILSSVDAKQIAGRAGRYLSQYKHGEVTTLAVICDYPVFVILLYAIGFFLRTCQYCKSCCLEKIKI